MKNYKNYIIFFSDDIDSIWQQSFQITNSKFDQFIQKAKENHWSFAYTQFCPGLFKYKIEISNKIE